MFDTRTIRSAAFAAALAAAFLFPAGPAASAEEAEASPTIPLTIVNNSSQKKTLYVYIKGLLNGEVVYVSDKNGTVESFTATATPKSFALDLGKARKSELRLPQLSSARVYLSLGKPVVVTVGASGVPSTPNGWTRGSNNFKTLFDWIEYTWTPNSGSNSTLNANTTQVDMFGFPMQIRISGFKADFTTPVVMTSGFRGRKNVRQKVIDALDKAGRPWKKLVVRPKNPLRVIAPDHGIEAGKFPKNHLQRYINAVYNTYRNKTLTVQVGDSGTTRTYIGATVGNNLRFHALHAPQTFFLYPKPDSLTVYSGSIAADPQPTDASLLSQSAQIAALLQGAFLRSTIKVQGNLNACKKKSFYKNQPVNEYAKAIHAYGIGKRAYAFGYDDTCNDSSDISPTNPKSMRIVILPF